MQSFSLEIHVNWYVQDFYLLEGGALGGGAFILLPTSIYFYLLLPTSTYTSTYFYLPNFSVSLFEYPNKNENEFEHPP